MRSPGNLHRRGCDGACRAACFDDMMHGMTERQGDPLARPPRSWRPRALMLGGAAALLFVAGALQAGAPDKGMRAQASGSAIPAVTAKSTVAAMSSTAPFRSGPCGSRPRRGRSQHAGRRQSRLGIHRKSQCQIRLRQRRLEIKMQCLF